MTNMAKGQDRQVFEKLRQLAVANLDDRLTAAITAYEDARIDGLCHDGAWECALAAMEQPKDLADRADGGGAVAG